MTDKLRFDKLDTVLVAVTPEMAAEWMKKNGINRKINSLAVAKFAHDMKADQWEVNGEAIKFCKTGRLLDGQHRLLAVIASEATVNLLVTTGLDETAFESLDQGRSRSTSDVLGMKGEKNTAALAAAARLAMLLEKTGTPRVRGANSPTRHDIIAYTIENPEIKESIERMAPFHANRIMSVSMAAGLHFVFSKKGSQEQADEFFSRLANGLDFKSDRDPIYLLRRRLGDRYTAPTTRNEQAALTIKAWNLFIANEMVKSPSLRWMTNEPFPKIDG